jgi:hypothetical protein
VSLTRGTAWLGRRLLWGEVGIWLRGGRKLGAGRRVEDESEVDSSDGNEVGRVHKA